MVRDVDLPTGYFLGMSAATGDLAGLYNTHQYDIPLTMDALII